MSRIHNPGVKNGENLPRGNNAIGVDLGILDNETLFNQSVSKLLSALISLGVLVFIGSFCRAWQNGWHPLYSIQIVVIVLLALLYVSRHRFPPRLTAVTLITCMHTLGLAAFISFGLAGVGAILALLGACLLCGTIYGKWKGLFALAITIFAYCGIGFSAIVPGWVPIFHGSLDEYLMKPTTWVNVGVDFLVIGLIVILSISLIQDRLRDAVHITQNQFLFTASALDSLQDLFFVCEPATGKLVQWNRSFREYVGIADEDIQQRRFPDDWVDIIELRSASEVESFLRGETGLYEFKIRSGRKSWIPVEFRVSRLTLPPSEQLLVIFVGRDMRERRSAERALSESEQIFRIITQNLPIVVWTADSVGRTTYVSPNIEKVSGYTSPQFVSGGFDFVLSHVHEDDRETIRQAVTSLVYHHKSIEFKYRMQTKDGRWIWIHQRAAVIGGAKEGYSICGVLSDISEQIATIEQLHQAEKNQMLGQLAGGVAHDFNNQIMAILGCVDLLDKCSSSPEIVTECAEHIRMTATHASKLTKQLLSYARKRPIVEATQDIHKHIREIYGLMRRSLPKQISLVLELCADSPTVVCDGTGLQNTLMNLFFNSRDAMPKGGRLTISTHLADADDIRDNNLMLSSGSILSIAVTDTGTGMDKQTQRRIFEPFFTTKPEGKGTGMGLATVYSFVKSLDGDIVVSSQLEIGTRITLYLPVQLSDKNPESEPARNAPSARILVVEPSLEECLMLVELLRDFGYLVEYCTSGDDALKRCRDVVSAYDLVIFDWGMAAKENLKTWQALVDLNMEIGFLFLAPLGGEKEITSQLGKGAVEYLAKPFSGEVLQEKIRTILAVTTNQERGK